MEFKQEIEKLTEQLLARKQYITNEEATKQSLIIPFIQKLGYDVFNPLEVEPEYTSDFGFKKGEKVDYAIKSDRKPIIFVEAKPVNEKVTKHSSQLYRYFNATPEVRFSILTNGIQYKLFTDLNQDNIMDEEPFYSFDLNDVTNTDIEVIFKLTKDNFEKEEMLRFSQELVYMVNINTTLKDLFKNPTDDFIRFLIKDINTQRVTNTVIEKFRPIIKKAINQTLLEMIGEGLSLSKNDVVTENTTMITTKEPTEEIKDEPDNNGIVTTEEELKAFQIVKGTLSKAEFDISNLKFKDNQSYFNILNRVITKWFVRLYLNQEEKSMVTKLDVETVKNLCPGFKVDEASKAIGNSRIYFKDVEDLRKMKDLIIVAFNEVKE